MSPYYQDAWVTLYHADACELLGTLSQVDHVLTDPPYSPYVHGRHRVGTRAAGGLKKELAFEPLTDAVRWWVSRWLADLSRRWCLVFSDAESSHLWRTSLTQSGLEYVRTGAWVKAGAAPQFSGDRPAAGYETITICHRSGKKSWNGGGKHAVWTHAIVRGPQKLVDAQKPLSLVQEFVDLFTSPGDVILDPFAGSGTTGVAAASRGRLAVLIERDEATCEKAAKRFTQAKEQQR